MTTHSLSSHLLRIEGVNLSHFVFDTRDLSTARGGSLLLLDAVNEAKKALETNVGPTDVEVLSKGASSGLFAIESADPHGAAQAVRDALATDVNWQHATFSVDVIPTTAASFRNDVESLLAANRWRQMQAASLAVPAANHGSFASPPACALDGLRPAAKGTNGSHKVMKQQVSDNVWRRREYGRKAKRKFYQEKTSLADLPAFANDFETIAKGSKPLGGKIAVFYADGNSFGSVQTTHCKTPETQTAWDTFIRATREAFLKAFLEQAIAKPEWLGAQEDKDGQIEDCIRFETLLWGGDEVMFVMPAALGWRFGAFFFDHLGGKNLRDAGAGLPDHPLTHAAALVFCQHSAPIERIKHLAKDQMAEFGKHADRYRDSLVVVALESFDHLGTDFEHGMNQRYNKVQPLKNMILADSRGGTLGNHLTVIANHLKTLRRSETFPRSQLRGLVNAMLRNDAAATASELAQFSDGKNADGDPIKIPPRQFRNATGEEKQLLHASLLPLFNDDPITLWLQLEELWDYALPESQ